MDKKARQILIDTYWGSAGWKTTGIEFSCGKYEEPLIPQDDFEYAKSKGVMFDRCKIDHDTLIKKVKDIYAQTDKQKVVNHFLCSLSTRKLELRSAIASYAVARTMPLHLFSGGYRIEKYMCDICGASAEEKGRDLNALNFERTFWGGVCIQQPMYIWFDLMQNAVIENQCPAEEDFAIFKNIIRTIQTQPEKASPSDLAKSLSKVVRSNRSERRCLLGILGTIGLLETEIHKGYFSNFITNRTIRDKRKQGTNDWDYPIMWWKGKDGINKEVFDFYFGNYDELKGN
jgi:hypothetical protein